MQTKLKWATGGQIGDETHNGYIPAGLDCYIKLKDHMFIGFARVVRCTTDWPAWCVMSLVAGMDFPDDWTNPVDSQKEAKANARKCAELVISSLQGIQLEE